MKPKSLLGPVIGDILLSTFSDKNYIYNENNTLLSDISKISGLTVITLSVAKYIIEYNHLYKGRFNEGRCTKRKGLLCKTILDLAKSHQELEYPVWLNKWLESDKCIPTKDADCMAGLYFVPLVIYFTNKYDLESTLRILAESISVITTDKNSILGAKALATAIYSIEKYNGAATQDFMACLYNIRCAQDLSDIDSKYGWKTSLVKALEPALSVFYKYTIRVLVCKERSVTKMWVLFNMIKEIDGLTTLVTPIVVTMVQAFRDWLSFDELEGFRDLLAKDLLEINDEFFEFISKLDSDPFSDLLELL